MTETAVTFGKRPAYWPYASEADAEKARHGGSEWVKGFCDGLDDHRARVAPLLEAATTLIARLEALGPGWSDHSSALVPVGELRALAAAAAKARGQ